MNRRMLVQASLTFEFLFAYFARKVFFVKFFVQMRFTNVSKQIVFGSKALFTLVALESKVGMLFTMQFQLFRSYKKLSTGLTTVKLEEITN